MDKMINRIPGLCLLISSLPGSACVTIQQAFPKPCLVKDTHLVFSIFNPTLCVRAAKALARQGQFHELAHLSKTITFSTILGWFQNQFRQARNYSEMATQI